FLSGQAADFLAACVRAGKNIVVSGRVSSGKTTLLNALGRAVPGTERVVVCESSAELQLPRLLPNCVGYEARPASADGLPAVAVAGIEGRRLTLNPLFEGAGTELRWLGSGPAYLDELEQAGFHVA